MNALLAVLALLAAGDEAWWNRDWKFRRALVVNNRLDRALEKGYTMQVEIDPDYLGLRDKSTSGFEDWALVHRGERVAFLIQPARGKSLVLSFKTAGEIRAGDRDPYLLYYGNPAAPPARSAAEDVFEFFEDFSRPETLAGRFRVDAALTVAVQDGALLIREVENGRAPANPCRIAFRKFPSTPGFELSFDLEMDSSDAAAAGCMLTIDLKEPGAGDPSIAKKVEALVEQLGDDVWEAREKATRELIAVGRPAVARLTEAAASPDTEVKWRANHILKQIAEKSPAPLISAGVVGGPLALTSAIGKSRMTLRPRTGWPVRTRVTVQRDAEGDVKVLWDGRSPQSGQLPGEVREVAFTIWKGSAAPLGTIRIDNILVRRAVDDDARPSSMIDLEEP